MTLFDNLRQLDPAVSHDVDSTTDPRALAALQRAMDDGGHVVAPLPEARPRWSARRLAVAGTAAAAVAVGAALLPGLAGDDQALAWSPTPSAVSPAVAADLVDRCTRSLRESIEDAPAPEPLPLGRLTTVVEARGAGRGLPTQTVHLADGWHTYSCYFQDGDEVASHGALATAEAEDTAPAADSAHANLGAAYSTDRGSLREVTGEVGGSVTGVTLHTEAVGDVVATVKDGHFVAWWPDNPTTEQAENARAREEISGATLTLADGSTRPVTVHELTAHLR